MKLEEFKNNVAVFARKTARLLQHIAMKLYDNIAVFFKRLVFNVKLLINPPCKTRKISLFEVGRLVDDYFFLKCVPGGSRTVIVKLCRGNPPPWVGDDCTCINGKPYTFPYGCKTRGIRIGSNIYAIVTDLS